MREKAHRPFRCLDCQYRRELVCVYLSNVEQIYRRFVEDRKGKFSKLIDDKVRWSSFRAFWLGIDQIGRRRLSRDKTDAILKVVVKHFFVEKEVTSTIVMDSLYSGLKALESQSKNKKGKIKLVEQEELPALVVHIENDMFVLADDVLMLLEKVALGSVPLQPLTPKDDKGSQNRTKDGSSGEEFNKDSIERDERHLTEFGRKTLEFFVLAHIFSRIEVAYQEAVALKRQEELIREEEAAEQAEYELKAKRSAADKEKRTKKKQAKQRRNSRKVMDRARDEKSDIVIQDKHQEQSPSDESLFEEFSSKKELDVAENFGNPGNTSDTSDTGDDVAEMIQPDLEDRDSSPINWDTDTSKIHPTIEYSNFVIQNGQSEKRTTSTVDDSSLTCSTDSVPSVVMNGSHKGSSLKNNGSQTSAHRGKNQWSRDIQYRPSDASYLSDATDSCRTSGTGTESVLSLNAGRQILEHLVEKEKELNVKDQVDVKQTSNSSTSDTPSALGTTGKPPYVLLQQPKQSSENATTSSIRPGIMTVEAVTVKESNSNCPAPPSIMVRQATRQVSASKSEVEKHHTPTKSTLSQQATSMSRPSSAPLIPPPRPTVPVASTVQTAPLLSRSVSAAGRLGTDPSPSAPPFVPQSYRNAITGKNDVSAIATGFTLPSVIPLSQAFLSSIAELPPHATARKDQVPVRPGLTFGSMKPETLQTQYRPKDDCSHPEPSSSTGLYHSNVVAGMRMMDISSELQARKHYSGRVPSGVMSFPPQGMTSDEFPHLDIINDLLDEDKNNAKAATNLPYHHPHHQNHLFNRHYSFPSDADIGSFGNPSHLDQIEQHYDEGFQRLYGSSSSSPLHRLRDGQYSQMDLSAYANGQLQGVMQNRWPYSTSDLSMLSLGNATDASRYSYQLPDYSNGVNGYMHTWPGNGH